MAEPRLDKIHIRDLLTRCIVGIFPEERTKQQDVVLNITLYADLRQAGQSDAIEDTIDYKSVKQAILDHVEQSEYFLVEKLAQAVAEICLQDARVTQVDVTLDKPGALRFARSVAVEISRSRAE